MKIGISNIYTMARTRSKGTDSPKTVTPKGKRTAIQKDSPAQSPISTKTKAAKPVKSAKKVEISEKKVGTETKSATQGAKDSLISNEIALKAISELSDFLTRESEKKSAESSKNQLFDEEDDDEARNLYLQINNKKYFSDKPQFKPRVLKITNSIFDESDLKTCLIIRDELVSTTAEIESLEAANLPTVKQIIPMKSLKTDYKNFEKRRQLYSSYDLFIIDDALLNLAPTVLGKIFYNDSKKFPLPIRVTNNSDTKKLSLETVKNQLEKCLASTAYLPPLGPTVSVKLGSITSTFTHDQLIENLNDVVKQFDLESIKSIMLKTTDSPSLPLYYAKELFTEDDKLENVKPKETSGDGVRLSAFEKGLLELGEPSEVAKILGKELKKQTANKEKKANKITKLSKTKA